MKDDDWIARLTAQTGLDAGGEPPEIPPRLAPLFQALCRRVEQAEEQLAQAQAMSGFFQAAADAIPNPVFIKDEQLRFVFLNQAYRNFFGLTDDSYIGKRVLDLEFLPEEDRVRYHEEDSEMLSSLSGLQYETSFHLAQEDLSESMYWSTGFEVPGTGRRGLVGEIVDISKEKWIQRELARSMQALEVLAINAKEASKTDPGTELLNRSVLAEEIPTLIRDASAAGRPVCILLMDIDHFKQVNDVHGHIFGDEILRDFARLLKSTFRQTDIAIRYGGDEFMMLLPGATLPQALEGAQRLCAAVRSQLLLPDGKNATVSVGAAQMAEGEDLLSFVARADEALYLAKKSGRDRVVA